MNIYDMVSEEETSYKTRGVTLADEWEWKMYDHLKRSLLYKNSKFTEGDDDGSRPFKNIIRPILNVAYRSEGFSVKDIVPFVNNSENYYKSFLVRKFNEKWARENDLDSFISDMVETYVDYGGVLVKNVNKKKPEVVPWQRVCFCDQTDVLSGTICEKHLYTIEQLKNTAKELGWYSDQVDLAIMDAQSQKSVSQARNKKSKTPQKYIEVYEIHGTFPEDWLNKDEQTESDYNATLDANKYVRQMHIVVFLKKVTGSQGKDGICLFKGRESDQIYKFLARDKIFGRALGFGGVEELFEPQVWTNFSEIAKMGMLQQASKIIYQTNDAAYTTRNNTRNAENGSVFIYDGQPATPLNQSLANLPEFDKTIDEWNLHAQTTGSANEAQLGVSPTSGTPFSLHSLVTQAGQGLHAYRQGNLATFMADIYRDWILGYLVDEMNKGDEWIHEISLDEMQEVSQNVMNNVFNEYIKKSILAGNLVSQDQIDKLQQQWMQGFTKTNKKFLSIVKGEFNKIPIDVEVNIANKQKDMIGMTDKLTNVFRTIVSNPRVLQIPYVAKLFNKILETSGLDQMDFNMHGMPFPPIGTTLRETINFKDVAATSPEAGAQMLGMLGIQVDPKSMTPETPSLRNEGGK